METASGAFQGHASCPNLTLEQVRSESAGHKGALAGSVADANQRSGILRRRWRRCQCRGHEPSTNPASLGRSCDRDQVDFPPGPLIGVNCAEGVDEAGDPAIGFGNGGSPRHR
jgi:hypothetical protein